MAAASPWLPCWPHPGAHYVQRIHLVSLAAHSVFALALSAALPWSSALAGTAGAWLILALRLGLLVEEPPRRRIVVHLVDEPLFWHWGNCVLGLVLLPLSVAVLHLTGWSPLAALGVHAGPGDRSIGEAGLLAYVVASPVSAWGIWGIRRRLRVRRCDIWIPGLPGALEGYRVVHLSDLHIGAFDPRARGLRWAERANACRADLCVVTGDFVTSGSAYHADAAEVVGRLQAPDGVFACMGNHDQSDNDTLTTLLEERGARVLRNQWQSVGRGSVELVVAGIDDRYTGKADLDQTLSGRPPGAPTILLAHDPYIGAEAARRGIQLVLSGHTHGGQVGIPWLADFANLTLLMRQPRSGLHELGATRHYISSGLGTTGPPLRLGVTPEIGLLVLRCRPGNMATP